MFRDMADDAIRARDQTMRDARRWIYRLHPEHARLLAQEAHRQNRMAIGLRKLARRLEATSAKR